MEISSNKKPTRGRPKSLMREWADRNKQYSPDKLSERGQLNYTLAACFIGVIKNADEETQRRILGGTWQDMLNGKRFPLGLKTAGIEIGRWIGFDFQSEEREKTAVEIVDRLLSEKYGWREIATYFKERRIGRVEGKAVSLAKAFLQTYNGYLIRYPLTNLKVVDEAIDLLIGIIKYSQQPISRQSEPVNKEDDTASL